MRVKTVDTRHGSLNKPGFSNGNTLPYTGVPFGMNYFVLQNQTGSNWMFDPTYPVFQGIRLTHQPSPWMGDFSSWLMTPVTGQPLHPSVEMNQTSYKMQEAVFQPHYFKADLLRYRLQTELVPTTRGAKLRLINRSGKKAGFLLRTEVNAEYSFDRDAKCLTGKLPQSVNDGKSILNFYTVWDFSDAAIKDFSVSYFSNEKEWKESDGPVSEAVLYIQMETTSDEIDISIGTSFLSEEQAHLNLEREVLKNTFSELQSAAAEEWESHLKKIEVNDRDRQKVQNFNQYLYRLFLFPQTFYEWDKENQPIHFDVYQEKVKPGKFFTNNGYWDTYKTVYPLFSLILPDMYQDMLEGIRHFYMESGHLPKWLSPDERGLMPGTLVNAVIADASVKGLLSEEEMTFFLDAMVKEATTPPVDGKFGRSGVSDMLEHGYVTNEHIESVNQTQDNAYSDFCIHQVARLIGEDRIAETYEKEALNYRHLFDKETGFMRGKNTEGEFTEPFVPEDWGYDYTEGSAWQNSLAVFHNFQDYIDLFGGKKTFQDHLIRLANEEPVFEIGNYGMEIHEMSEFATADFGHLAISNQPSFHIPYLFSYIGKPAYTQLLVKQLCEQAFTTGFDGFPGDEDNGSLSGWFVFSSLGFYPVTPGTTQYVIGIPQFDESILHLPDGKTFKITAANRVPQNNFIQQMKLNGESYKKLYLDHADIVAGGTWDVRLGLLPPEIEYGIDDLPYSLKHDSVTD